MAGKRVLLATELVRGPATAARILPLAVALADRGHDISLCVPDRLAEPLNQSGFPIAIAPTWNAPPPPGFVAVNYADLLQLSGYAAPDSLEPMLAGWRAVLLQAQADLIITDFAPTAMLASRITGTPLAVVGDGYSLPPPLRPMPVMRPWAATRPTAATESEGRVLAVIDACMAAHGKTRLRALRDLFTGIPSFLCTFPELDHYPSRTGADYYGEIFAPSRGAAPTWPTTDGERAYVDLDPRHPGLGKVIGLLDKLGLPALVQGHGLSEKLAASLTTACVHITTSTNRAALVASADIIICQGADLAVPGLLAGKPLLMLPVFVEQMMTLHRIAAQGLGTGVSPDADEGDIDAALRRLVDDRDSRSRAAAFAQSYDGYRPGLAIDAIADAIDEILA